MKFRTFALLALFVTTTMYMGLNIAFYSWDGVVFFYPGNDKRQPAGINRSYDYSHLKGRALKMASQERILSVARVVTGANSVGIELGHFVTKNKNKTKNYACKKYHSLELQFHSSDMAVNSEPSVMIVQGRCQAKNDINRIDALWIPYDQVLNQKPGNIDLQFLDPNPVSLRFQNISDSWPRKWHLKSIKLYNDAGNQLFISQKDVRKILKKPISLIWVWRRPARQN